MSKATKTKSSQTIFPEAIVRGGRNFPGGHFFGGNFSGDSFPGGGGILLGSNFVRGFFPGFFFPQGISLDTLLMLYFIYFDE